ncbi:amino acid adenylation domain-containing protein [Streptomyces hygroscopicus]|uniref:non-ribosomal peptide synthetase n=1 Tax=Streptomyces hygroscopicus TaxID=1912 RepID=UPI0036C09FB7
MKDEGRPKNILEHIVGRVALAPQAVAACDPAPITYRELARESDRLAAVLAERAGRPSPVVGVHADRGNRLLIALVAILKAGGTYLPLNPDLPAPRLSAMVEDAAPDLVLTDRAHRFADLTTLPLDTAPAQRDTAGAQRTPGTRAADAFRSLLYTSGSTGRAKGVLSGQEGLRNRLVWMGDALGIGPEDRILQKTPISFDVSLWELLWPLMNGASVVFARPGGHLDGRYLHGLIRDRRITVLHFVPAMLGAFLQANPGHGADPALDSVRLLVTSGEALTGELAAEALDRFGAARLANLYGPTEASIDATWHLVGPRDLRGPVPIGRPIAGMAAHVVDADGRPVGPGRAGELWLSGAGLAEGYVNLPEATAAAFLEHPPLIPADRVYRTGDLVRQREDGVLEFLGRRDRQVKFRGVRVELSEIDSHLSRYPGVNSAHTLVRRFDGGSRLVAFVEPAPVVLAAAGDPDTPFFRLPAFAAELRGHLAQLLPASVVPGHFVFVRAWPTGTHGKLDESRLHAHLDDRAGAARPAPDGTGREAIAGQVLGIFRKVLKTEDIEAGDNFFEAGGGGSLQAVRVAQDIEEYVQRIFGLDISADASIFIHPTALELADEIERGIAARLAS